MRKNFWKRLMAFSLAGMMAFSVDTMVLSASDTEEKNAIVVDVNDEGYMETGKGWAASGLKGYNGGTTRYSNTFADEAQWTANLAEEGEYDVYLWRVEQNKTKKVEVTVTDKEGEHVQEQDWTDSQTGWTSLGEYQYDAGSQGVVKIKNTFGNIMRTSAVKFVPKTSDTDQPVLEEKLTVNTTDDQNYYEEISGEWLSSGVTGYEGKRTKYSLSKGAAVEWKPVVTEADEYSVRLYHPVHYSDVENEVKIEVIDADGNPLKTETVVWTGSDKAGWIELGSYELPAGQIKVRVTKTDRIENPNTPGEDMHDQALRADAVQLVRKTEEPVIDPMPKDVYYVDASLGDDENAGTSPETAWKTLDKVNHCEFAPGSQILLKKGETWEGRLAPKGSGNKEEVIKLGSYGAGEKRPVINGNGCEDGAVGLYNQEYWEITGLEVTNWQQGEEFGNQETYDKNKNPAIRHGIYVELEDFDAEGDHTAEHIYVKDCYVHDVIGNLSNPHNGVGIFYFVSDSKDKSRFHDVRIEGNDVRNIDRSGIIIRSQDTSDPDTTYNTGVVIEGNYLENIAGDGIVAKVSKNALIQYNEVNEACARATGGNVNNAAVWVWQCKDSVIQYNEVYNTGLYGGNKDGQAFDSDFNCEGCVIQYNYSHNNDGGFVLLIAPSGNDFNRGTIVRYNISENDKKDVLEISGEVENAQIYNNTIYQSEDCPTNLLRVNTYFGVPNSALITNNIFQSDADNTTTMRENDNGRPYRGSITFDHNLFYGFPVLESVDQDVDEVVGGIHYQGHWKLTVENSLQGDPLLKDPGKNLTGIDFTDSGRLSEYQLEENSPAVDAGATIEENGGVDFRGVSLDDKTDMGACEYVNTTTPENPEESEPPVDDGTDVDQNEDKGETTEEKTIQTGDAAQSARVWLMLAVSLAGLVIVGNRCLTKKRQR